MFKYLHLLLWANLGRKRLRTQPHAGIDHRRVSVVRTDADAARRDDRQPRAAPASIVLITMHKTSFVQSLPLAYLNRIKGVDGVVVASLAGLVRRRATRKIAIRSRRSRSRAPTFFEVYNEYKLTPEEKQSVPAGSHRSAIVGQLVAQRFGWKVGDTIPLRSNVWTARTTAATSGR